MLNVGIKGFPADQSAVVPDVPSAANQTETEAASITAKFSAPGTLKFHPGVAKAWAYVTISGGTPTLAAGHNFSSSIADNGPGDFTLTFSTALSSAFYAVIGATEHTTRRLFTVTSQTTTSIRILTTSLADAAADPTAFSIVVFGDFT